MKILIADDEQLARTRLRGLIAELALGEVVAEAADGEQVLAGVAQYKPDVVLLDIRMPGMDGLETATRLDRLERPPAVVFTTAYDEYALAAFEAHAVDYLLKPVRREHLSKALQASQRLNRAQLAGLQQPETAQTPHHLSISVKGGIKLVAVDEVYYLQAEHKYVTLCYKGGSLLMEESLRSLEEKLAPQFVRIHRNALVAVRYLQALEKDKDEHYHVRLSAVEAALEVSRRHVAEIRRLLKQQAG